MRSVRTRLGSLCGLYDPQALAGTGEGALGAHRASRPDSLESARRPLADASDLSGLRELEVRIEILIAHKVVVQPELHEPVAEIPVLINDDAHAVHARCSVRDGMLELVPPTIWIGVPVASFSPT